MAPGIEISPTSEIQFNRDEGGRVVGVIRIRNTDSVDNAYFKVRLTAPKNYSVKRKEGEIKPNEEATVLVLPSASTVENATDKDRFQIISLSASNQELADQKWKKISEDKAQKRPQSVETMERKLRCSFSALTAGNTKGTTSDHSTSSVVAETSATLPPYAQTAATSQPSSVTTTKTSLSTSTPPNGGVTARKTVPAAKSSGAPVTVQAKQVQKKNETDLIKLIVVFIIGLCLGKIFL